MPAPDSSEPDSPQRPKPARRDPRLDAKAPTAGQRSPARPKSPALEQSIEPVEIASLTTSKWKLPRGPVLWGVSAAGIVIVLGVVFWAMSGRKAADDSQAPSVAKSDGSNAAESEAVGELREPVRPVKCQIKTPEPGFVAFVDEQPVRDDKGEIVLTPCEVSLEKGRHVIRVAKKGWNDIPRVVDITEATDFDQEPTYEPFAETGTTFKAPYVEAPIGEPILLQPLVFKGRCQDPFVAASGREIWYAASGPEGMGIYYSTRATPYDEWETPALLVLSRGSDLPASPSATEDGLLVGYTVPGKVVRVWGLTRKSPEEAFDDKKPLHFLEHGEAEWPSAQLSADGKRLYWLEQGKKTISWMASRYELEVPFGKGKKLSLPGGHPCLSADELRQYSFDGKQLSRARRAKLTSEFSEPQVIADVSLPAYVPHPERRQFWVTDDEQWLYYAEDPATSGNLFAVRLSNGPGRGVIVLGRPIIEKPAVIAKADVPDEPEPASKPNIEEKPVVDPLSLPTDYAGVQQKLAEFLAKRDIAAASQLLTEQQQRPELQSDRELLAWDVAEVAEMKKFWQAVEAEAGKLKAGDSIRIGGSGFTLEKYTDGVLTLKTKTKTVERRLKELSAGDLLAFADKAIAKTDPAGQLGIGIFLHFEGKGQAQSSKLRLERTGTAGEEFLEHLAVRRLKIIEHELARQNLGAALQQIDELAAAYPSSPSTKLAEKHRDEIYSYVKWETRGSRKWDRGEDSSYTAAPQKQPGSLLVSSTEYERFDLSLEWKTIGPTGQGGVYFRYPGSGKPLETAFKVHLANDQGVAADKFCTGSLFNYNPPTENAAKSGQWNTLSMQVRGEKVTVTINGKKVQELLATDPAVPVRGFVALDGEFGGIVYRKILLVEGVNAPPKSK